MIKKMTADEIFIWYELAKFVVKKKRNQVIKEMQNCNEYDLKLDFANKKLIAIENYLDLEKRKELFALLPEEKR